MRYFIKILSVTLCLLFSFFTQQGQGQVIFTSWVHAPSISLYASVAGAGIATSASVSLDDAYSDTISMGMNFNYFGTPQTQCLIGANGNVSFNLALANGYNAWPISAPLLGNAAMYNTICGPWCDMDVAMGGEITYFTYGTAPNRQFVTNFCHNAMYSCVAQNATTQIILYETSDVIETHIEHKAICAGWNGGFAIIGVQSDSATASATTAPGRDYPSTWTATDEAWRFTPASGGSSYTVSSIPYASIPYYTVYWYDSSTGAYLGSGDSIVLTPTAPTTYRAVALSCGSTGLDTAGTGYMHLLPVSSTGIEVLAANQKISIYPNPANNELNIAADEIIKEVTVTDLVGQTVTELTYNSKMVRVNISTLPPGVYLVKVNGSIMRRFVKE